MTSELDLVSHERTVSRKISSDRIGFRVEKRVLQKHSVKRWSPADRKRMDVNSPAVTAEYAAHYSGVDHKDRDTADWTVSVRGSRFYMRIFFWLLDSVIHAMYCIVKYVSVNKGHPWHKYNVNCNTLFSTLNPIRSD